jgi:signal recognition particle receptor subunit beta
MALFNYATKEITLKIVYYGPGLSGKTTNLQHLHSVLNPENKGRLLSLSTEADRTLFFDFLPVELGRIRDFSIRFQLYTVPGQVRYNATRKVVLKGADAVVFVADSQHDMKEQNVESFENMRENLLANNINPDEVPVVLQYNKRDLGNVASVEELNSDLNRRQYPIIEASAISGTGVEDSFRLVTRLLLKHISKKHQIEIQSPKEKEPVSPGPALPARKESPVAKVATQTDAAPPARAEKVQKLWPKEPAKEEKEPLSPEPVLPEKKEIAAEKVVEATYQAETLQKLWPKEPAKEEKGPVSPEPAFPEKKEVAAEKVVEAIYRSETIKKLWPKEEEAEEDEAKEKSIGAVGRGRAKEPSLPPRELEKESLPVTEAGPATGEEEKKASLSVERDDRLSLATASSGMAPLAQAGERPLIPSEKIERIIEEMSNINGHLTDLKNSVYVLTKELKDLKEAKKGQEETNRILLEISALFRNLQTKKSWFRF